MAMDILHAGFELAGVGIACLRPDAGIVAANAMLCDLLGYTRDDLMQLKLDALLEPESAALLQERMRAAPGAHPCPGGARVQCRRRTGEAVVATVTVSHLAADPADPAEPAGCVATFLPWAGLRSAEDDEMFRFLVESATDYGIMRLDRYGVVQSWSVGAERIFGFRRDEIIGQPIALIFNAEDRERGAPEGERAGALAEGKSLDDRWHVRRDGSRLWASGVMSPLYDKHNELRGFVKIVRDLTERKLADERYRHLSEHDVLTGLPNRAKFYAELNAILAAVPATRTMGAVCFIDLDHFKEVNDSLGHHHGDLLLQQVAQRLRKSVRGTDIVARLSGDEFGIIYTGLKGTEEADRLAGQVVRALGRPYQLDQNRIVCGASIGVAMYPRDGGEPERLLKSADLAMYRAKGRGRNTWQFYVPSMDTEISERRALARVLTGVLDRDELVLHYQPRFNMDGTLCGVEAFLRLKVPPLSELPTADLVSLAEETGLIVPIGEWVVRTACRDSMAWRTDGARELTVSINLSSRQLHQPRLLEVVRRTLETTALPPHLLEFEITESVLTENDKINLSTLASLQSLGVRIAIDDFGTGSSSLSELKHLPVNAIELDGCFVHGLPDDDHDTAIASAVIGMAHGLGLDVVAEGVENDDQLQCLKRLGCNRVQGFLLSPPLPAEEIAEAIDRGQWAIA